MWNEDETQYCDGCGLYHYRGECSDKYFNAAENWSVKRVDRVSSVDSSASDRYRKRFA